MKEKINKELVAHRFTKAVGSYHEEAVAQKRIAEKMTSFMSGFIPEDCGNLLEIGCGTGIFSRMLLNRFNPQSYLLNDICPEMKNGIRDILRENITFQSGDAEQYPFMGPYNVIASCSTFQWFSDIESFFDRCNNYLSEEGYLAFSTFGQANLKEITLLTGESLPYYTREELVSMLSSRYHIVQTSEEQIVKTFHSPMEVLYHLKRTGVTGTRKYRWTRSNLQLFCKEYDRLFRTDDLVSLTYHPIYIIVRKRM